MIIEKLVLIIFDKKMKTFNFQEERNTNVFSNKSPAIEEKLSETKLRHLLSR